MSTRRAKNTRAADKDQGVFQFSYPDVAESNSNQGRKRHFDNASQTRPEKSARQRNDSIGNFSSPQPELPQRSVRFPASASRAVNSRGPASPAFNQPVFPIFKQSTPMHKATTNERAAVTQDRKRGSPMKNASLYKTPEKKKRIYSSDEEELEFSPSGRRMPIAERRTLLQNTTQWSARVDQEERFHGVYVKSVERLKQRLLSESMQSVETSTTCSEMSDTSLDLSSYEVDETVLTRRQKQIAYGKNTEEYEFYARRVDKMGRSRNDPQTPDKFDRVSRRRFDGRIKTWRVQIHRWFEKHGQASNAGAVVKPVATQIVADENTVTVQGGEGTMTEAPVPRPMQSSPVKRPARACVARNIPGLEDESAVDAFQSPKKAATGKSAEVHTELTCDLAGFAICQDSQSTLTGAPATGANYQTRSRARLVFS